MTEKCWQNDENPTQNSEHWVMINRDLSSNLTNVLILYHENRETHTLILSIVFRFEQRASDGGSDAWLQEMR